MPSITSKLPLVGTTIFTTMSVLAAETGAVNLGQGFPDFDCDPELLELIQLALTSEKNQYAPMGGVPVLCEAIAQQVASLYGGRYAPASEVTITAGATQALFTAISCLVQPGDEVILFEPVYDSYEPAIRLNGGIPVYSRLRAPDYRPDWDEVRSLITPRTRAIIINSPHNPTARLLTRSDLEALSAILKNTDIFLISDEVYEHIVYDGQRHESVCRYPDLAERAFVISSFGKTFHVTGWKIAYCLAPKALMQEFRKAHQFMVFCVHAPSQYALAEYLGQQHHLALAQFYQDKRDLFLWSTQGSGLHWLPSEGTYFVSGSYAGIPEYAHLSDREFAELLTRKIGVACIPLSAFYHDGFDERVVRFCFAKKDSTVISAAERLKKLWR
ncbi:MAG TPA: methionine aminotransferase [Dongiaceae bacterium]|nr:methionine aminotransferase [Dongiaceae bacterium]